MFAILAALAFVAALILDLAGGGSGHFNPTVFMYLGLVLLALSVVLPGWPSSWPRRSP